MKASFGPRRDFNGFGAAIDAAGCGGSTSPGAIVRSFSNSGSWNVCILGGKPLIEKWKAKKKCSENVWRFISLGMRSDQACDDGDGYIPNKKEGRR